MKRRRLLDNIMKKSPRRLRNVMRLLPQELKKGRMLELRKNVKTNVMNLLHQKRRRKKLKRKRMLKLHANNRSDGQSVQFELCSKEKNKEDVFEKSGWRKKI
ncbi:hypothetical protein ACQ4LE_004847 [Meloidogyne hapla]